MFLGTTPTVIMQYVQARVVEHKPKRLWVPFAGNFCIEQIGANVSKAIEIHSTDVSLYSRGIGFGLTNQPIDAVPGAEFKELFPFVWEQQNSPIEKAAQLIFFTEIGQNMEKRRVMFYKQMVEDGIRHQEAYYKKILGKLASLRDRIGHMHFYGKDAVEIMFNAEEGDVLYYDRPFFADGYAKMFEGLESRYVFKPEPFTEISPEMVKGHLGTFNELGVICYYRSLMPMKAEDLPENYEEVYRYGYKRDGNYHLYSNAQGIKKAAHRFNAITEVVKHYPVISETDTITKKSKVNFLKVQENVSNHYRLMWVKKAKMTRGGVPYLIFVDEKLIGLVHVQSGMQFSIDLASIFTDPAAPTSKYVRLSKLIIYLVSTEQFLKMFNEEVLWEHVGLTTKVFSNKEVSMKYRGVFERVRVEEIKGGDYKYSVIYQNRKNILKTYKEALSNWIDKFGKMIN